MEKHFCNYEISLALKELGFNEPTLGHYRIYGKNLFYYSYIWGNVPDRYRIIKAPLISQAIEWLLKELDFGYPLLNFNIYSDYSGGWDDDTGCLKPFVNLNEALLKGIELCKKQK